MSPEAWLAFARAEAEEERISGNLFQEAAGVALLTLIPNWEDAISENGFTARELSYDVKQVIEHLERLHLTLHENLPGVLDELAALAPESKETPSP